MENLTAEQLNQFAEIHNLMDKKAEDIFNKHYTDQRMCFESVSFQEKGEMHIEFDWDGDREYVTLPTNLMLLKGEELDTALAQEREAMERREKEKKRAQAAANRASQLKRDRANYERLKKKFED